MRTEEKSTKRLFQVVFTLLFIFGSVLPVLSQTTDPLFVNLTTDDTHAAHMAIMFGKNQQDLGHPLTVFLNNKGVYVASQQNSERFGEHQNMLKQIMDNGGTVLVCPMCMKHYAVKEGDLLPGMQVGNPNRTGEALFRENTVTLTW